MVNGESGVEYGTRDRPKGTLSRGRQTLLAAPQPSAAGPRAARRLCGAPPPSAPARASHRQHPGLEVCVEYGDFATQFFGSGGIAGGGLVVVIGFSAA